MNKYLLARLRAGIKQKEVAEKIGVDQSAVSMWERGKNKPRPQHLFRLAELYGCTVDELLKEVD